MLKQAISTISSEPPLIATGHENIKNASPLVMLWKDDKPAEVVVSDVFKGIIHVKTSEGKIIKYNIPTPIEAQKRTSIQFIPAKVGEKLKKGDIVYRSMNLAGDGQLQLGQNLRTAFMYWRGHEFEDSIVISESCSHKLTHMGEYIMHYDIREGEAVRHVAQPGQVVSSLNKDVLITIEKELNYTRSQEGLNSLIKSEETQIKLAGLRVPNNVTDAMVVDVKYFEVKRDMLSREKLDEVINLDYRNNPETKASNFIERHGEYPARSLIVPDALPKGDEKGLTYRVYFKLVIASPAKAGDKICSRFGNKGVLSDVVPDKDMPRDLQGNVIDIIINPSSVIARKVFAPSISNGR